MFYSLKGPIVYTDSNSFAIECGGVAFRCAATRTTLNKIGLSRETVTVYTYMHVREDALELFGFHDSRELDCFKLLINVTGVGPKAALAILSELTPDQLALCVASGDAKSITLAQGVGAKLAQRVILELKDKLAASLPVLGSTDALAAASVSGTGVEAVDALVILGYSRSEAAAVVGRLEGGLSTEEQIKQALKALSKR